MQHKTFPLIEVKADEETGSFQALASVFGNVDHVGDRMLPGSFEKTLEDWRASGDPIPVILSHQWSDPFAMVGKADPRAVYEDERGLVVQGQLDMSNDVAKQVHKLMKDRLLKGWSFGYTVPKGGQKMKDGVNEVSEVELIEVGPTLVGANSEAHLETIKSALHDESDTTLFAPGGVEVVLKALETAELPQDVKDRVKAALTDEVEDGEREEPNGQALPQDPMMEDINKMLLDNLKQGAEHAQS